MLREVRQKGIDMDRVEELESDLPEMARHCSDMERRADDAERELVQWKKVRFMADKVGDEFDGYITGVAAFGLFVQLTEHYVEGLVHVSSMADDYYRFLEKTTRCAERTPRRCISLAIASKCRWCASIWIGVRSILGWSRFSKRCGPMSVGVGRATARRARSSEQRRSTKPRKQRPGRRERQKGKRGAARFS